MATFDQWLQMTRDPDPQERLLGLEGLVDANPAESREIVLQAIADDSPMVRATAARLAERVEPGLTPGELRPLLRDEDEEVRLRTVRALEERAADAVLEDLLELSATEESPRVLATLTHALGRLAAPEHLPRLAALLEHEDARVRANTVEALDDLLQRSYRNWLGPLARDPNNRVRANVAVALARYDEDQAATILTDMVGDEERWMRMSASWAAGASGMPKVVEAVLPLLHDPDPSIRIQTLRSLAQHRRLPTRRALHAWLAREEDPMVLQYASELLSRREKRSEPDPAPAQEGGRAEAGVAEGEDPTAETPTEVEAP